MRNHEVVEKYSNILFKKKMRLQKKERKTWKLVFNFSILYRVRKTYFKGYQQVFQIKIIWTKYFILFYIQVLFNNVKD
jgi:hypothetical protein